MSVADTLADALVQIRAPELAVYLLSNVPGLPPIVQALHILGIGAVMGSVVMIDLRLLGIAVPTQNVGEMVRRLMPWMWGALLLNACTGLLFVVARPERYFNNPVFQIKFALLVPAVILAFIVYRLDRQQAGNWEEPTSRRLAGKAIAALSLVLWVGVVLAGRWIAYAEYLFY